MSAATCTTDNGRGIRQYGGLSDEVLTSIDQTLKAIDDIECIECVLTFNGIELNWVQNWIKLFAKWIEWLLRWALSEPFTHLFIRFIQIILWQMNEWNVESSQRMNSNSVIQRFRDSETNIFLVIIVSIAVTMAVTNRLFSGESLCDETDFPTKLKSSSVKANTSVKWEMVCE